MKNILRLLATFKGPLIKEAERKNFNVVKIEGKDITEKTVRSRIKHRKPRFIFFNGHGNTTSLFNNDKKTFIDTKSSDIFRKSVTTL